jgi:hypothetical protein
MPKRRRHAREDSGGQTTTLFPDLVLSLERTLPAPLCHTNHTQYHSRCTHGAGGTWYDQANPDDAPIPHINIYVVIGSQYQVLRLLSCGDSELYQKR